MIGQILCATDLSLRSGEALRVAASMATVYNVPLILLNVHEEFMDKGEMVMLRVSVEEMQERFDRIAQESKQRMHADVRAMGVGDLEVGYMIREGKPAETILRVGEELQEGLPVGKKILIVLGTNSKDTLKERLLGSVAIHVVQQATCPVLAIPYTLD